MKNFKPTEYKLKTVATGREFEDEGWMLDDPHCGDPSLIRAGYRKEFTPVEDSGELYRFSCWLPVCRTLEGSCAPVTYKSETLARELGLNNLYITFSGWFPEKGARMATCSFKETEAYSVCGRMNPGDDRVLVVASAGNTARAFAKVCSDNGIPLLLSVPEDNISALWFDGPLNDCVKLICAQSGGDYYDAIHLGNLVLGDSRFCAEGGAKNIARRDGMATTVLSAVDTIGNIPQWYFQAVGSGTGAIAAWEANLRLIEDGRFGDHKMRLIVSQNAPFLPMYEAWKADSRDMLPYDDGQARRDAEEIIAKVLSNRKPPYGIAGGLYDALKDTAGDIAAVTNEELCQAQELFSRTEGVDIHPAAAVALASLQDYVKRGEVGRDDIVMLNITGGGEETRKAELQREGKLFYKKPDLVFPFDADCQTVLSAVGKLFR